MLHNDNLEDGMLKYKEKEPERLCGCAWCGEAIYIGEDYYDLEGESVCSECIETAKRKADAI